MSCIYINIYVFTTYDYTSIPCIFYYYEVGCRPWRLSEFQCQVVSLLPFYISYVWFYFLPYIPVHFYSYWCPVAWGHCIFVSCVQVQVGTLIDPSARISGFSCELVSSTSSWSFHRMVTFVVQFGYSWGLIPTVLMTLLEAIVDTIFWVSFCSFQSPAHRLGMYIYVCRHVCLQSWPRRPASTLLFWLVYLCLYGLLLFRSWP